MKENRYEVVYCDDLSEEQYPGPRSSESFFAIVDTLDGTVFETDRMEPEDASFCRDLSWVPDELNRKSSEILHLQREKAKLFVRCLELMIEARQQWLEYGGSLNRQWKGRTWGERIDRVVKEQSRLQRIVRRVTEKYLEVKL